MMVGSRLALDEVTICAADCLNPQAAARALARSMRHCRFGDAILFTDAQVSGGFRTVPIAPLTSRAAYSDFMLRGLAEFISTPFVLIVQWDGYVVEPAAWSSEFLAYDYIGAVWPWHDHHRVGNGGFSLRSRKLLLGLAEFADVPGMAEDELICRRWRPALETTGVRFAPEGLAARFSYERARPERPSFGFHGMFNMWRYLNDDEMVSLIDELDGRSTLGQDYVECFVEFYLQRRFAPLLALHRRWRESMSAAEIAGFLGGFINDGALVRDSLALVRSAELDFFPDEGAEAHAAVARAG